VHFANFITSHPHLRTNRFIYNFDLPILNKSLMKRKSFIKKSILASGAFLLPNTIWASKETLNITAKGKSQFIGAPNLNKYKISGRGIQFFETELSISKLDQTLNLHRKFFISENTKGIGTPALLETQDRSNFIFIPELYKDDKYNGFFITLGADGECTEEKIFTHENQGYYAFWGKEYLGQPTLYHYNLEKLMLMRIHKENGEWLNHQVIPMYPNDIKKLYKKQLQEVSSGELPQQFGYDFKIYKDGFYDFLFLKNGWEQSLLTKEKELYEKENPAPVLTQKTTINRNQELYFEYSNPFKIVPTKGDDLSGFDPYPTVIYEEVPGSKIEIPNMPAIKTQDDLGECRAFSMTTLLQKFYCDNSTPVIEDCKNPSKLKNISSFGMMSYTNSQVSNTASYEYLQTDQDSVYNILNRIQKNNNGMILDYCKPFDKFINNLNSNTNSQKKRDDFFTYLQSMYNSKQVKTEAEVSECPECLSRITAETGISADLIDLKNALSKKSYNEFLYSLFFKGCNHMPFRPGFKISAYPDDSVIAKPADLKNKIRITHLIHK
jgi:hypothetical protein